MTESDAATLTYCAAKAGQVLTDLEEALGDEDAYLVPLILLFAMGAIAEEKGTPSYQMIDHLRSVRRMARIERM